MLSNKKIFTPLQSFYVKLCYFGNDKSAQCETIIVHISDKNSHDIAKANTYSIQYLCLGLIPLMRILYYMLSLDVLNILQFEKKIRFSRSEMKQSEL